MAPEISFLRLILNKVPFPHKYILDVRFSRVILCYKRQYFLFCAFVFVFKGPFSIFEVNFEKVFL